MKLVKMNNGQIGLFTLLPQGAYAVDIVRSLGVFAHDPLSNGLLNGTSKEGCDWSLVVKHWAHLRGPLTKLAWTAISNPNHPNLALRPLTDDLQAATADPIVAIEITDMATREQHDPTGRRAMERQFVPPPDIALPSDNAAPGETAQVIDFSPHKGDAPRK
jgi:hypothetical protein